MDTYFKNLWQQVISWLSFGLPHYDYYLLFILGAMGIFYLKKLFLNQNLINHYKIQCSFGKNQKKIKEAK